jgi:hypothetical protein
MLLISLSEANALFHPPDLSLLFSGGPAEGHVDNGFLYG